MLWHPFSDMHRVPGREVEVMRGEGCWIWDANGRSYLDATAGLWFCNVGHGRRELADAALRQMRELAAFHVFDVFTNPPAAALAERVCALSPTGPGSAAFFTPGGSEGVESAMKIVRRYWRVAGEPDRRVVIARGGAYHGMSAYGTSLAGIAANAEGWGELVGGIVHVAHDDADALAEALRAHRGRVAAVIGEPVIGAGGVLPPSDGYWPAVRRLCDEEDVLLIADEVVCGFGRLGSWFGSERYDVRPDLLVGAKGISSGYAPVGVVVVGARVRERLWAADAGPLRHGYTYSGHATCCAVALANLELIEREGLVDRVAATSELLPRALAPVAAHPLVSEVRTAGLLAGVEIDADARAEDPTLPDRVVERAREEGLIVRALAGRALQVSPPFTITEDELAYLAERLQRALTAVQERPPAAVGA